jgi:hypothetical protein
MKRSIVSTRTPRTGGNRLANPFGTDFDVGPRLARDRRTCGALPISAGTARCDELLSQSVDLEFIPLDGDAAAAQRPGLGQGDEGCA